MENELNEKQKKALVRAISCYLETLEDSDEQYLIREVLNKLGIRKYLSDDAQQRL